MPMASVHIFISTGCFWSAGEARRFIDLVYTEGGDGIPSRFVREVGPLRYEPA